MKTLTIISILILFPITHFSCSTESTEIKLTGLKCEYLTSPLGIDVPAPRLSWKMEAASDQVFNQKQQAYQILVASSVEKLSEAEADLWNSGKIESDASAQIVYQGKKLTSGQKCYWKVKIWNDKNDYTPWSDTAVWGMGLLTESDWMANWIGDKPDLVQKAYKDYLDNYDPKKTAALKNVRPVPPPSPMLRKKFTVKSEVREATLYVSALGYYELGLNGKKIGDQVLAPEWTDYNKRLQYQAYDVSKSLKVGDNALSAILGDGWYLGMIGPTKWHADYPRRGVYGNDRRLIAQLVIRYLDGTDQVVSTDESWKINTKGFIISADNFLGQKIDARNILLGWQDVNFDDTSWEKAYVDRDVKKNLEGQKNEPVRVYKHVSPVNISPFGKNYIVDFGQNLTGWTRLTISGKMGDLVKIRHGEMLDDDGSLYTKNLAAAVQEDEYILSGGQDVFEPVFTYHGFRYIEISGLKEVPGKEMIMALAISSDPEVTGSFECSNPKLNQLWSNILWTQRDNMTSIPTDCPQRDERMGWMGDAQVFCQNSMFNMDMAAFYTKWIKDIRDAQSVRGTFPDIAPHANKPDIRFSNAPAWADAGVIVPWRMYQNYGDTEVLRQHYDAMKKYLENIRKQNPDFIWVNDVGNMYGDWLNANTVIADGYSNKRGQVPNDVFATAFFANSARLLSRIATVLNNEKDAKEYLLLFEAIRTKFNEAFVDGEGRIKGDTQSAYALALDFDLLPESKQDQAFKHLVRCIEEYDYRISTGFISTIMLMKELTKRGRNDIAYTLMESERFPSWIYSINQWATTIWERWDGYVKGRGFQNPGMNSFCHYSIGSVGEWMYRVIAGINPDDQYPGYKHFIIHPQPGGTLTWAKGSYNSIYGRISTDWKKGKELFTLDIEIPVNTSATVILPSGRKELIRINSKSVSSGWINKESSGEKETAVELGSGKYHIEVTH
ncbi:MAG: glycoside hydrolase family 78 protein [Bacteroidia bacterium]|nr:glycoside hydrolase family 78 protein [Bacteroidia bacterium]